MVLADFTFGQALLTVLEIFSGRWPLEVCFCDVRQISGLSRSAKLGGQGGNTHRPREFLYLALLWYAQSGHLQAAKYSLDLVWYPKGLAFL